MNKWKSMVAFFLSTLLFFSLAACDTIGNGESDNRIVVRLAAPQNALIDNHIKEGFADFISGKEDIHDDAVWEACKAEFYALELDRFLVAAQKSYEQFK